MSTLSMNRAAGDAPEGLARLAEFCQLQPIVSSPQSTSGSENAEPMRPAGDTARSKPVPAAAADAGSAPGSAQPPKLGAGGLITPEGATTTCSREQPADTEGQTQLQLTRAGVQSKVDTGRVDRAAAALDAMQAEAAQAERQADWMVQYLDAANASILSCCGEAGGEAEALNRTVRDWRTAQNTRKISLAWAESKTQAQLAAIREAWEGSLQAFLDRVFGREGAQVQLLPVDATALVEAWRDGFGRLAGCYEAMHMRCATYLHSATSQRQFLAAATCTLIRLVS